MGLVMQDGRLFPESALGQGIGIGYRTPDLQRLQTHWRGKLDAAKKRKHAAAWKVIDLLLEVMNALYTGLDKVLEQAAVLGRPG